MKEACAATLSDQGTFVRLTVDDEGIFQVCLVGKDNSQEFIIAQGKDQEQVCEEAWKELLRASELPKLLRLE